MAYNKSLLCPLTGAASELERALNETERFCKEENLDEKQTMHMRLLAEEVMGMVGSLLRVNDGVYWVEHNDDGYELHLKANAPVGENAKTILIGVSSDNRNAAYDGIKGKLRRVIDAMVLPVGTTATVTQESMTSVSYQPTYMEWDYHTYMDNLKADKKASEWDELEKSVLGKLTRNIIIGVRPMSVDITLKAK